MSAQNFPIWTFQSLSDELALFAKPPDQHLPSPRTEESDLPSHYFENAEPPDQHPPWPYAEESDQLSRYFEKTHRSFINTGETPQPRPNSTWIFNELFSDLEKALSSRNITGPPQQPLVTLEKSVQFLTALRRAPANQSQPIGGSRENYLPWTNICGKQPSAPGSTQLIIGGKNVTNAEFPWLVALFHFKGIIPEYKCGASLISDTYVITAAHCVTGQLRVHLELGRHDILNPVEDGYVSRVSLNIYLHPNYESGAHRDIALILIEKIQFTPKIRPICLWTIGTILDNILLKGTGTIAGWGLIENDGDSSKIPRKLNLRLVDLDTCRNSNEKYKDIVTDQTFCAGGQNTGPCHGDSGSGFYIQHKNVWYLRGIISTSLGNAFVCNLEEYSVYTDLAYYLDFIRIHLTT